MNDYKLYKNGRLMATAHTVRTASISWEDLQLPCFFFPKVVLDPPIVFEHLAGTALSRFLHGSELRGYGTDNISQLGYVHGRSEVLRGRPRISSVLLVQAESLPSLLELTEHSAKIYSRFLEVMENPTSNP